MKQALFILLVSLFSFIYIGWENRERRQPRAVFCDVGQGDASYFRLAEGWDVLVDAGPYSKILSCLDQELPYFDRTIEMVFITHPEKDHFGGFLSVLDLYRIEKIFLPLSIKELVFPKNSDWSALLRKIRQKQIPVKYLVRGEQISIGRTNFIVLAPNKSAVNQDKTTPLTELDLNNLGLGLVIRLQETNFLLLADLDALPAEEALEQLNLKADVFKVSHHGSRYGLSEKILNLAEPQLAVLSVGQDNFYGHPHQETLDLLRSHKIPLKRTDSLGKIEVRLY